jgi:hypothetical protein
MRQEEMNESEGIEGLRDGECAYLAAFDLVSGLRGFTEIEGAG